MARETKKGKMENPHPKHSLTENHRRWISDGLGRVEWVRPDELILTEGTEADWQTPSQGLLNKLDSSRKTPGHLFAR